MQIESITNIASYTLSMKQSLLDKVFFADKIGKADVVVDYGCADGQLLKFLSMLFPEWHYYGYDISPEMISLAKKNNPNMLLGCNWCAIESEIREHKESGRQCALVLSSIVHEIYSYGTARDIEAFWTTVFNGLWDYIIIRDMIPGVSVDRPSDINDIVKVYSKANRQQLYDFQTLWGSVENNKNLVHWLLKYRYMENWHREVKENYMPVYREHLLSSFPDNYRVLYHEHYVLPYIRNHVVRDFGIELKDNTHLKLVLEMVS